MISANIFFFECLLGAWHCSKCSTIIFNVPATLCGKYSHYPRFTNGRFGEENLRDLPKKLSDKTVFELKRSDSRACVLNHCAKR